MPRYDALNPRTASREIPRGVMSRGEAAIFITVVVRRVRLCGVEAWNRSASCCRPWRWRSSSGTRWRSASRATRRCSSAWRWRSRRSAAGSRQADAVASSRGCSASRSGPGLEASTCCTPARISTSISAHGLRSIPVRFGVARAARDLAGHARRHRAVPRAARDRSRTWAGCISPAWPASLRCSCSSSRSCPSDDLSQVKRAFDLNGYVGILYLVTTAAAIYVR